MARGSQVTCPYCYQGFGQHELLQECAGDPQIGQAACDKEIIISDSGRDIYARPLAEGPDGTACHNCGGATANSRCGYCMEIMPTGLTPESELIGLVGPPSSGKTVYTASLARQMLKELPLPFESSIRPIGESEGRDKLEAAIQDLDAGRLPQKTLEGKPEPAVVEWRRRFKGMLGKTEFRSTILSFYDGAGENYAEGNVGEDYVKYIQAAGSVILLVDPFALDGGRQKAEDLGLDVTHRIAPEKVLNPVTEVLRRIQDPKDRKKNKPLKQKVAVAVAKIDAFADEVGANDPMFTTPPLTGTFDDAQSQSISERLKGQLIQWGAGNLIQALEADYATFRFFPVSALGAPPTSYQTGGELDPNGLRPIRVSEPIQWLLAENKFIPKSKG